MSVNVDGVPPSRGLRASVELESRPTANPPHTPARDAGSRPSPALAVRRAAVDGSNQGRDLISTSTTTTSLRPHLIHSCVCPPWPAHFHFPCRRQPPASFPSHYIFGFTVPLPFSLVALDHSRASPRLEGCTGLPLLALGPVSSSDPTRPHGIAVGVAKKTAISHASNELPRLAISPRWPTTTTQCLIASR
jgi:hypothetical protein